jgi:predicted hotdog family 3-hydroxylacyl-ACP dehydratase
MSHFPSIEDLLMHREKMLLLQEVTAFSDEAVVCRAVPDAGAWYTGGSGGMPAWIGIELMAQAIAAHVALHARSAGKPPRPGALLGTRAYRSVRPSFPAGEPLAVHARQTFRNADGLASYDCTIVSREEEQLATAALTVYEPEDFDQFISGTQS